MDSADEEFPANYEKFSCFKNGSMVVKGQKYSQLSKSIDFAVLVMVNGQCFVFLVDFFSWEKNENQVNFHGRQLHLLAPSIVPNMPSTKLMQAGNERYYSRLGLTVEFKYV